MPQKKISRRDFVASGAAAGTAAFMARVPLVHAGQSTPTLKAGLIGCGGRGKGAAGNFLAAAPNVQITALADVFEDRVKSVGRELEGTEGFKVTPENCFTGLDAYKKVLESGVDVVLLATSPGFRPLHFAAAVEAGKHVFMEKPVAVDPAGVRKVIEVGKKAREKELAVLAGTQYRHQKSFIETIKRVHDGWIGEIVAGRAYYNTGLPWAPKARRPNESDMEWQIRNWLFYDWLSGDHIVEQHIHTIDVTDWVMNARPVRAVAVGGRQTRVGEQWGNVYDHFCVDYEYPKGVHVTSMCRQWPGCPGQVAAYFRGTKGEVDVYNGVIRGEKNWSFEDEFKEKPSIAKAYVQEHTDWIESIRAGKPINEATQVAESSLTAILGREAAYTGKAIAWADLATAELDLSPPKYEFGPNPVRPMPIPGKPREGIK
ncbi:MAG TPA: Gfo/Idh/MocA family oxidoreductase [Planctomycetota bacterium]|nr:Gfo/Idh/MocA family oxidoreductase [Planctomycetota bacterium]